MHKNEIKFIGKTWVTVEYKKNINQTTNADHQKRQYHTITGSKLVKTTSKNDKRNLIGPQHRPIRKHIQEVPQTLHHQSQNKEQLSQNTNKTGCYPIQQKNDQYPTTYKKM